MTALICLTVVAVAALVLAGVLGGVLLSQRREHDELLRHVLAESQAERRELTSRVQAPGILPTPPRAVTAQRNEEKEAQMRALRDVGTVAATPPVSPVA